MNWHERYLRQASWTRDLRQYLFEKCRFPDARRVLEVGCGTGAVLGEMPRNGPTLHGVDISGANLRECREHVPAAQLTSADACSLPYARHAFDVTFCHFVLLWLREPLAALREMKRVTASSGYVIAFAEPDYGARIDRPAELSWLGQRQNEALQRQGAALRRGAELADLFRAADIGLVESGILRQPNHALSKDEWDSEWQVLEDDVAEAVPRQTLDRTKSLDGQARARGEHTLNVPTYFAWGQV